MAPATQRPPDQQPQPGGDPPQPSSKRPLPTAEAAESNRNPKMQKIDYRSEPVNLDHIVILATGPKGTRIRSSLNKFGSRDFPNQLRPHHFDYEALRNWLWEAVGIDSSAPLVFVYLDKSGEKTYEIVANDHQFNAALVSVTNGSFVPFKGDMGPYFGLCTKTTDKSATKSLQTQAVESHQGRAIGNAELVPPQPAAATTVANSASPSPSLPPQQSPVDKQASVQELIVSDSDDDHQEEYKDGRLEDHADGQQPEIREPRLDDFDESVFQRALQFFQTTEGKDGKCEIRGQLISFHFYQVYRVFCMLKSPTENGINGMMIDWDTGFGKTLLAWLYLHARARLASRWTEAKAEWEDRPDEAKRRHLPVRCGQAQGASCPTQRKSMVVCPCVEGSDSRRICETYLTDTPALVVMPPALAKTWLSDLKKGFPRDSTMGKQPLLNVYTYISNMKDDNSMAPSSSSQKKAKREEIIEMTAGEEADDDEVQDDGFHDDFNRLIKEGSGNARDVFLVSNSTVENLIKLYPVLLGEDGKPIASFFTFGVVFMDEFHKYKGNQATHDTIPFKMVRNVSSKACHPVSLYPMSGTTIDEGPSAWRAAVEHYLAQWKAHRGKLTCRVSLTPDKTLANFDNMRKKYNQLLRDLSTGAVSDVNAKAAAKEIRGFLSPFVTTLRQGQIYRAQAVNKLPAMTELLFNMEPQMDNDTTAALQVLINNVNTLMERKLKDAITQWKANKRRAEEDGEVFADCEPTSQSIMAGVVSDEIKISGSAFPLLQRSSMYPHIAHLVTKGAKDCTAEAFATATGKPCLSAAVACQRLLLQEKPEPLGKALLTFSNWEFAAYRQQVVHNSAKYQAIRDLIMKMVYDNNAATAPPDGSGKRQAVIFCSQNISASITYYAMLTDPSLSDVVEPLLICSDINTQERQNIVDYFNRPSLPQSRNKVLIGVVSVSAEGYNIQRANNVWFAELPITFTKQQQAIGRAHRQQQKMEVAVVKLQEQGNLMEEYGYQVMEARKKLQRLICDVAMA